MKRSFLFVATLLTAVVSLTASAAPNSPEPVVQVDFRKNQVMATNLTPGTQALVYGLGAATTGADRPKEFVPGGVMIALDAFHMQLYAVRLDGSILNGSGQ